ncbi:MAG: hypothetical protein KF847_05460 [Pirellulales bacterium]|nr:hypothetical protein [Pirellulales bacterium]
MAGIVPIPNSRISGLLARERLTKQLQADQLDVFRLQEQISTGRRITLPSEDAPAALRAITLQRLIERKTQISSNVSTGLSYLDATWQSLSDVSTLLGDIRGAAVGVSGTATTEEQRQTVVNDINRAIEQLVNIGNTRFRGRYLFAGSQTNVRPYTIAGDKVLYAGDSKSIRNFSDIGVLFESNATGQDVFGGISAQVLGGTDLNPQVTASTRLSSLNGGSGVSPNGALQISDGFNTVIVDVSKATTVGDVARFIESSGLPGRALSVTITGSGLVVDIDDAGGGNLTITEVASGRAARELGILNRTGVLTGPLVGSDLNPVVLKTTRLDDLLGSKATTRLESPGSNNDLIVSAAANGAAFNDVTIQIVDSARHSLAPGVSAGDEYVEYSEASRAATAAVRFGGAGNDLVLEASAPGVDFNNVQIFVAGAPGIGPGAAAAYDPITKRLTITVDSAGTTTIDEVVNAVNAEGTFTATGESAYDPAATIPTTDIGSFVGDTGNSGGAAKTLYVYVENGRSTASHVAAAINAEGTFTASIDARDSQNLASAGVGVVSLAATATTAAGSGTTFDKASGIRVVNSGQTFDLDFSLAETVDELLNILNGSDAGLLAEINEAGNGINIRSRLSGGTFQIGENGGQTASQLGVRTLTGETKLADLNDGIGVLTKRDSLIEPPAPSTTLTDVTIVVDDGAGGTVELALDLSTAKTIQDVLDQVNNHPLNNAAGVAIRAQLTSVGNGVEIVDLNGRPLEIQQEFGSHAAEHLGLIPAGQTSATSSVGTIVGRDTHVLRTDSVFTTLVQLRDAIAANDVEAMGRAIAKIDADLNRASFARSDVGARQQALELSQRNLEDEDVRLRSALSDAIDVDLVEAISNLVARQASLQASLQTTASILQMSLLNFL